MNPMNLGGRINPDQYHNQSSALTNGFMSHSGMTTPYGPYMRNQEEAFSDTREVGGIPTIDTTSYASHQNSAYGSPREDLESSMRSNLALSPGNQVLSILDAPLPPSFDSNGVSLLYRNGPQAASVPSKFGLESPPQSLISRDGNHPSEALKDLHNSVFGDETTRDRFNGFASSPSTNTLPDGYFGKRIMHSSQQRISRPKMMSASAPKGIDRDWDDNDFDFEEEYLPENLNELLTPAEKARRGSRNAEDLEGRPIYSGSGTPGDVASKVGSPSNSSPSRWNQTFLQKQQRDDDEKPTSRASQFGHVGSPLRPSSLHSAIGSLSGSRPRPISRPGTGSGDDSSYLASPPRQAQISLIAQGIQRVRLASTNENGQHVSGSPASLSKMLASNPPPSRRDLGAAGERAVSSSSIGTARFATTPIDEEQPEFVFDMDDDEAASTKRNSGGWGYPVGGRSPHLGALGARTPSSGLASNETSSTNGNGTSFPKLYGSP